MSEIDNIIYIGKILFYNGNYGFIISEMGKTYFHKTCLKNDYYPKKDDEVEFQLEQSAIKPDLKQAYEIVLLNRNNNIEISEQIDNRLIGMVKWFDEKKGFGIIATVENVDYFLKREDFHSKYISAGNVVVFYGKNKKGKKTALKCTHFFGFKDWKLAFSYANKNDMVQVEFVQDESWNFRHTVKRDVSIIENSLKRILKQKKNLSDKELCMLSMDLMQTKHAHEGYIIIKEIKSQSNINNKDKESFFTSVFEIANDEYKYKMLFDGLIIFSKDTDNELLNKYLMKLGSVNNSNFDRVKLIAKINNIEKNLKDLFLKNAFDLAIDEYKYKMLFEDKLIDIKKETAENQLELLQKFSGLDIAKIKLIYQSEMIDKTIKNTFLKSAFEKADAENKYKMLYEDKLIDIQKETYESQIELLSKYLIKLDKINNASYVRIKSIAQSDLLDDTIKITFLKSAFEITFPELQYKMLFEDNLIDIHKFQYETQIEFLQKIGRLDIEIIKSIIRSDMIEESVKNVFLKTAFEKASVDCQYKMLFEDCLVNDISKKLNFLLNTSRCGRMKFSKGKYGGKSYFEVLENDIEYLHKNRNKQNPYIEEFYDVDSGYWSYDGGQPNVYNLSSKYINWKKSWYFILNEINKDIKNQNIFTYENTDEFYKIITQINDAQELFEIFGIEFDENNFEKLINNFLSNIDFDFFANIENYKVLSFIKKYNSLFYNTFFEQNYSNVTRINRLRLWLNNLNPNYNYIEFVQSAWQLSNDERKLLNKRIKEHAKDERLLNFINQIPKVEIIEKTANNTVYKCKWRNLYYHNGSLQVFLDKNLSTESFKWDAAREEWNLLTHEYFNNRKIDEIIVKVNDLNNNIIEIEGLQNIEVKIIVAEVRKYGSIENVREISSSQLTRIIHNVSARNQCVSFLASQQSDYNVIDIHELVSDNYGSIKRDISFLFLIPDGKGNLYFVWESIEFEKSKATHIFKSLESDFDNNGYNIKNFIENNLRSRTLLNSTEIDDIKKKEELNYFCRIDHNMIDYLVWENRMKEVMPFLI